MSKSELSKYSIETIFVNNMAKIKNIEVWKEAKAQMDNVS